MKSIPTKFRNIGKTIANEYGHEVEDIIIFGSTLKGKEKAKDLDVLIIFKNKIYKSIESEIKKRFKVEPVDINSISKKELETDSFIAKEGVYLEGISIMKKRKISDMMGFSSFALVKYDIGNIKGSDRIRFYYALQGRNQSKGFLDEVNAKRFSESVIICDYAFVEKLKSFFNQWEIEYQVIPSLIPKRLRHILLK